MSGSTPNLHGKPMHGLPLVLMTLGISFATFMEVLDLTIVNVSVPTIAGALAVSPEEGTWVISSYALASAIMQPLTGWRIKTHTSRRSSRKLRSCGGRCPTGSRWRNGYRRIFGKCCVGVSISAMETLMECL